MLILSHFLSKIFLKISPSAKIGCLLDNEGREGSAHLHPPVPSAAVDAGEARLALDWGLCPTVAISRMQQEQTEQQLHNDITK